MDEQMRKKLGIEETKPVDWFETLYSESNEQGEGVPWANMAPHPVFQTWINLNSNIGIGKTALVIGCGMGDDAIELEKNGFEVTAFDVSHSAIELCKKRFLHSKVSFIQADLLKGIHEWNQKFDFVLEIFTIQALPPKYEDTLIKNIADFVAPDGQLLMVTEVQKEKRTFKKGPPWLLNKSYKKAFESHGLKLIEHSSSYEPQMGDELHLSLFRS
ncbi:Methyltransferase domain-containing protein [Tenacibaculum sp. MAR_2009_124]|uniref:class I SAM-dependent methyltransferase n=1 Tax=Tenacibaculum sp. MAR_2009_124 TaxID=1250059 RepID=UPI0008946AC9|nr:class I SAM-dependent methyltransferase [Tenacibaculum sp. MAR_2009_124]SED05868.1 Methyltransferase domain-containing protein [Tenacibaculum sp. MAR_2009_124]